MDNKINNLLPIAGGSVNSVNKNGKDIAKASYGFDDMSQDLGYEVILSDNSTKESDLSKKLAELEEKQIKDMYKLPEDADLKKLQEEMFRMKKEQFDRMLQAARACFPNQYTKESWRNLSRLMSEAMSFSSKASMSNVGALNKAISLLQRGVMGLRFSRSQKEYKNILKPLPMEPFKDPRVEKQIAFIKEYNKNATETSLSDDSKNISVANTIELMI